MPTRFSVWVVKPGTGLSNPGLGCPKKANVDLVKKMKLYDGEDVEGYKSKDVRELKEDSVREGMDGISPRYIINRLSSALVRDGVTCINPIDALRAIKDGFEQHTAASSKAGAA